MATPTKDQTGKPTRQGRRRAVDHLDYNAQPNPLDDVNLESPLNPRELRFLELYFFSGKKMTQYEAAKKAGYKGSSKPALCNQAKKIIEKYESLTDPREIFRQIGLGEAQVASRLLALADDTTIPPSVRLQALNTASKCLGLQREGVESVQGARIIINTANQVKVITSKPHPPGSKPSMKMAGRSGSRQWGKSLLRLSGNWRPPSSGRWKGLHHRQGFGRAVG
jgi:hypothetical protein